MSSPSYHSYASNDENRLGSKASVIAGHSTGRKKSKGGGAGIWDRLHELPIEVGISGSPLRSLSKALMAFTQLLRQPPNFGLMLGGKLLLIITSLLVSFLTIPLLLPSCSLKSGYAHFRYKKKKKAAVINRKFVTCLKVYTCVSWPSSHL